VQRFFLEKSLIDVEPKTGLQTQRLHQLRRAASLNGQTGDEIVVDDHVEFAPVGSSVSEACSQIGKIASKSVEQETGVQGLAPVEWDTTAAVENLHVTEPYFLFYLRSSPKLKRLGATAPPP
jgi:hypothetical protein